MTSFVFISRFLKFFGASLLVLFFVSSFTMAEEIKEVEAGDLYFNDSIMRINPENPVVNQKTRLYFRVENTSNADMKGVVRAYDITESVRLDTEQSFTTVGKRSADLYWDFTPQASGVHEITFRIIPWEQYPENSLDNDKVVKKIFIDSDFDKDGVGDQVDNDDDNDGVSDGLDLFPFDPKESADSDGDGKGDNADNDDDNDGVVDSEDTFPNDSSEGSDSDGDGIGNNTDDDDDGDGIRDESELLNGTNPLLSDTDGDGVDDGSDDYPKESRYQKDTDRDGVPNKEDNDDDGDGVKDHEDAFPEDGNEWQDLDGDGVGDIADTDDDNDGLEDEKEMEIGSNARMADTDGDGVNDGDDALPLNASESADSDGDGLGDEADPNDNNKGPQIVLSAAGPFSIGRNEVFTLSAENSQDPENTPLTYLWELFNDKEEIAVSSSKPVLVVKSSAIGEFTIRLTVTDGDGESRLKNIPLSVSYSQWDKYAVITGIFLFLLVSFIILFFLKKKRNKKNS